ncbi:hypothetical protein GOP47_0029089 [Adiantum capillus-veneris]|nr:hypothetical protein GOP47_0029089 [Adiantum capillus-veneris]
MDSFLQSFSLPASIPLFIAIYAVGYFSLFPQWKYKARFEAASCSMSLVHGAISFTLAAYNLLHVPWQLDAPNSPHQNSLMDFSIAYFLVDLLHYVLFVPEDYKFIFHHVATSIYMLTCKYYVGHGAVSVMALMAVGEITTPLQSVWTIARLGRVISPRAKRIYESASLPFTILFTVARGIVGPILTWKLCKFYLLNEGRQVIPFWLAALWMGMVVIGMAGSVMWMQSYQFLHCVSKEVGIVDVRSTGAKCTAEDTY